MYRQDRTGRRWCSSIRVVLILWPMLSCCLTCAQESAFRLNDRNTEAPFCYVAGGRRVWPVASGTASDSDQLMLRLRRGDAVVAEGNPLGVENLRVSLKSDGTLSVVSTQTDDRTVASLELRHQSAAGQLTTQVVQIRPAPPARPLTYLADFGDDIIRMFGGPNNQYRPITEDAFDQYFRRLQAQGISRLIVWQSPFPYIVDPSNYTPEDWQRYAGQATAILESQELTDGIRGRSGFSAWGWLRQLMALRLMPGIGEIISRSAQNHGITLTASFRPFEAALTKYYVVPVFDADGSFLWNFQPLCSPTVNYHPEDIGFVHYRETLRHAGHPELGDVTKITFPDVDNAADLARRAAAGHHDLQIKAAPFPPLDETSFVLFRNTDRTFSLRLWRDVRPLALSRLQPLKNLRFEATDDELQIHNVKVPRDCCYLWMTQPADSNASYTVSADTPVRLLAAAGNRLGGENLLFCRPQTDDQPEATRVCGIPADGHYHAEFQATEASTRWCQSGPPKVSLQDRVLVVNIGPSHSVEMMDFTQSATREFAVKQLRTILSLPGFQDIVINTRSHTQLAGYLGDTGQETGSLAALYRSGKRNVTRIGIDKAYVPRDAANDVLFQELTSDPRQAEQITTVQPGAWRAVTCQSPDRFPWRFLRNRLVANGARRLLQDLEEQFPEHRIQVVIPPSEQAVERILTQLETLKDGNDQPFGRDHYRRLWSSNNHIPTIGEGMAMVDLSGTRIEPIFLGTGGTSQIPPTFSLYVSECTVDLADNRGSSFRGPRSYFYEAQSSLRATDRAAGRAHRESVICSLLTRRADINEVILYEAADWTYFLPLNDPDLCGHHFLDRCDTLPFEN